MLFCLFSIRYRHSPRPEGARSSGATARLTLINANGESGIPAKPDGALPNSHSREAAHSKYTTQQCGSQVKFSGIGKAGGGRLNPPPRDGMIRKISYKICRERRLSRQPPPPRSRPPGRAWWIHINHDLGVPSGQQAGEPLHFFTASEESPVENIRPTAIMIRLGRNCIAIKRCLQ